MWASLEAEEGARAVGQGDFHTSMWLHGANAPGAVDVFEDPFPVRADDNSAYAQLGAAEQGSYDPFASDTYDAHGTNAPDEEYADHLFGSAGAQQKPLFNTEQPLHEHTADLSLHAMEFEQSREGDRSQDTTIVTPLDEVGEVYTSNPEDAAAYDAHSEQEQESETVPDDLFGEDASANTDAQQDVFGAPHTDAANVYSPAPESAGPESEAVPDDLFGPNDYAFFGESRDAKDAYAAEAPCAPDAPADTLFYSGLPAQAPDAEPADAAAYTADGLFGPTAAAKRDDDMLEPASAAPAQLSRETQPMFFSNQVILDSPAQDECFSLGADDYAPEQWQETTQRLALLEKEREQLLSNANDATVRARELQNTVDQLQRALSHTTSGQHRLQQELADAQTEMRAQAEAQRLERDSMRAELATLRELRARLEQQLATETAKTQARILELESELSQKSDALVGRRTISNPVQPALGRAHRRSATSAFVSAPRLSTLAERESLPVSPRPRLPAQEPRKPSHLREDISPAQRHQRRQSLQMLRARMDDAEASQAAATQAQLPTSTLSIVQGGDAAVPAMQDANSTPAPKRNQPNQFSNDALLFCSSCQGDLIIV
ncbi:hypothetical protein MVES_000430 [Malassezia vespertilionis]|uniref:Uncharacterized protein n=2 Tax=Malassezia vespertilionis TaxID=2020962 RepID=A0A2N1JFM1_9BASI|nr:hypothetical protein MVES_000430 [Malassezia vespertilionis]